MENILGIFISTIGTIIVAVISNKTNKKVEKIETIKTDFNNEIEILRNDFKNQIENIKRESDKTFLTDFISDLENNVCKTDIQKRRAYEIYEEYQKLNGNSYIHDHWEKLIERGLL